LIIRLVTNLNDSTLSAVEKAVLYLERDELPPHWDREILFNMGEESTTESSESEEIDDDDDDDWQDSFVFQSRPKLCQDILLCQVLEFCDLYFS